MLLSHVLGALLALQAQDIPTRLPPPVRAAADRIVAAQLMTDVEYLASDALRGRDTFSPGFDSAAAYIMRRLRAAGLKPVGDSGTFRQLYSVKEVIADTAGTYVEIGGRRFAYGDVLISFFGGPVSVTAPVAYVGHGWRVPSRNIDPYAAIDVRGKVVLVNGGALPPGVAPGALPPDAQHAVMAAPERGALALAYVASARMLGRWDVIRRGAAAMSELDPPVRSAYARPTFTGVLLKPEVSVALLAGDSGMAPRIVGVPPNAEFPAPFQLARAITLRVPAASERMRTSYNVVAVIEGSDPRLRSEYVTFAAHLDGAVGTEAVNGDSIYNAADDNASGSAALLAIAEQMARGPRPRRSQLYIWDSGEEVGLFGTRAFVGRKLVPLADIVTHVNIDMMGTSRTPGRDSAAADLAERNEVFVTGPRVLSATLDSLVNQTNRAYLNMRLNFTLDTPASEFFYPRTDAGPFMERGIPVIEFFTGLHNRYHGPADEAHQLDPAKVESVARTVFTVAWMVANSPVRPTADKGWPSVVPRYP